MKHLKNYNNSKGLFRIIFHPPSFAVQYAVSTDWRMRYNSMPFAAKQVWGLLPDQKPIIFLPESENQDERFLFHPVFLPTATILSPPFRAADLFL